MPPGPEPTLPQPAEDWSALKDAVRRFEDAWRQGPRPAIDDYLPPDDRWRCPVLIELVHLDLELRLKAGEAARAEEYLARYPELAGDRRAAVELIAPKAGRRRRGDPALPLDDSLQRFPAYHKELLGQISPPTVADRDTPHRRADSHSEALPEVAGYDVLSLLGSGGMG